MSEAAIAHGRLETGLGSMGHPVSAVQAHSCGTWYSLLLCLLFECSFQAKELPPLKPSLALCLNFTIPRCVPCVKASMAGLMNGGTKIFIPL